MNGDKYDGLDGFEIRLEAERIISMDYVPSSVLLEIVREFAPQDGDDNDDHAQPKETP